MLELSIFLLSNVDYFFALKPGTVGNTTTDSPRSTVALKADTLRFIARENIKLVTKTDWKNSQGGELTNMVQSNFGINLIAMNDDKDMQPLVKGNNLKECLREIMASIHGKCVEYGSGGATVDYVRGANVGGFVKVADAMLAYGLV